MAERKIGIITLFSKFGPIVLKIFGASSGIILYKIEISDLILKPSFEGITMPTSILLVCVETFLIVVVKGKNPITPPF